MKKTRFAIISLSVMLIISVAWNIYNARRENLERQLFIYDTYWNLGNIKITLDGLWSVTDIEQSRSAFEMLAILFATQDTIIQQRKALFPYMPNLDTRGFLYISETLGSAYNKKNGVELNGILRDSALSEDERLYLSILSSDIQVILDEMASSDGNTANNKLSSAQINSILSKFFNKWSLINVDTPFLLLHS